MLTNVEKEIIEKFKKGAYFSDEEMIYINDVIYSSSDNEVRVILNKLMLDIFQDVM